MPSIPDPTLADLIQRDLAVLWHPCSQMRDYRSFTPLPVVSAQGPRLYLADGRVILDAISSWWCKALGHRHPQVIQAILDQAQRFEHVILANTTSEPIVRLSERLLRLANHGVAPACHLGKVFFASDGSTAVEIALKMAFQAQQQRGQPQRTLFAFFENAYHGETLATLSVSDCPLYSQPFRPLFFPAVRIANLPYRSGPDDPRWLDVSDAWPAIQSQLDAHADRLAALIFEPVLQAAGGMRLYSPQLFWHLRRWADRHGVYLIADEIASGFGRLGAMLAQHLALASPHSVAGPSAALPLADIVILAKGLTAGTLPLSAVLVRDDIYQLFDADYIALKAFLHSNTHCGNALAVAAANATLDVFESQDILGQVALHGPILVEGLKDLGRTRPYLRNFRGLGMMAAADLTRPDGSPLDWRDRTGFRVYRQAVQRGALLRNLGETVYLFPPLNTPPQDLYAMLDILAQSLDAVLGRA